MKRFHAQQITVHCSLKLVCTEVLKYKLDIFRRRGVVGDASHTPGIFNVIFDECRIQFFHNFEHLIDDNDPYAQWLS